MKALFLLLFLPVLAFGQINMKVAKNSDEITYRSPKVHPVVIQNGNAVNALYEFEYGISGEDGYFNIVIYTHSYRDALKPSDEDALFIVDGLGKVFKISHWTSRYEPEKIVSSIVIRMSKEEFKSISYAGTVGVKIGTNSFSIPHMARHKMRQVMAQIESHPSNKAGFYNSTVTGVKVFNHGKNKESVASNLWKPDQGLHEEE